MTSCADVHGSGCFKNLSGSGFGVRSYLHYFYEECTASVWDQEDIQSQRAAQRWSSGLCKVCLAFGVVVLAIGLVILAVGFSVPSRIEAFGEGELLFVDRQAVQYNQGLNVCVQVGTGMLSVGGVMIAAGLLLSAFSKPLPTLHSRGREKKGFVRGGSGEDGRSPSKVVSKAPSPAAADGGVPVNFSKVENIQP